MRKTLLNRTARLVLLTAGIMVGIAVWRNCPTTPVPRPADPARVEAWDKVASRLRHADMREAESVQPHLDRIKAFFAEKRLRTGDFAEELLGWSGKWAFVKSKLFGDDGKAHKEHMRQAFEQHLFNGHDLEQLMRSVVQAYLSELEGRENALLVEIRTDLSEQDLPALRALESLRSDAAFTGEYRTMLDQVTSVVGRDLKITIGREAAVWVGSEVAAAVTVRIASAVAVRLGVSGGILGSGAASGVATFGVGLAVGFLVDGAVDWFMRQHGYDPAGEISRHVTGMLNNIENLLLNGDAEALRIYEQLRKMQKDDPVTFVRWEAQRNADRMDIGGSLGLRHELLRLQQLRGRLRETALRKIIFSEVPQ